MLNYNNPFCYILVGPIATNKSKVAEEIAAHPAMKDCVVISTDSFVSTRAAELGLEYNDTFDIFTRDRFKRYVVTATKKAVASGKSIIVDRCNLTRKSRKECLIHVPDTYNKVMVVMDWDKDKIIDRIYNDPQLRAKKIPFANVLNMFTKYQAPFEHECDLIIKQPVVYDP